MSLWPDATSPPTKGLDFLGSAVREGKLHVKFAVALFVPLAAVWMLWSGHTEPFLLLLGSASCLSVVVLCRRLGILDDEAVPFRLGWRPFTRYAPWLLIEIIKANLQVVRVIFSGPQQVRPRLLEVKPLQQTEIGRVIFANSITLTPGTVSVDLRHDVVRVHALTTRGDIDQDETGDMNRRVLQLEERCN